MKINKIVRNKEKIYLLEKDSINVISFDEGELVLPYCTKIEKLQILFQNKGIFKIYSQHFFPICLGNDEATEAITMPGTPSFDTQPTFIFDDDLRKWFCVTSGNLILKEKE